MVFVIWLIFGKSVNARIQVGLKDRNLEVSSLQVQFYGQAVYSLHFFYTPLKWMKVASNVKHQGISIVLVILIMSSRTIFMKFLPLFLLFWKISCFLGFCSCYFILYICSGGLSIFRISTFIWNAFIYYEVI